MKNFIKKRTTHEVVSSVVCDVCQKEYDADDFVEMQEFHHIDFVGGYGSVFEDMSRYNCDICQHCLKEKLGPYIRKVGETVF